MNNITKPSITIPNWSNYQSYRDRRPPWIKFHREMIDNYEFQMMKAESRALLPMLWLLACENKDPTLGLISMELKAISFRLHKDVKILSESLKELESAGFIDRTETVPKPYRNRIPETETEAEAEADIVVIEFAKFYASYPKKQSKPDAERAFKKLSDEDKLSAYDSLARMKADHPNWQGSTKYIPLPATYLNGRRWEDEIPNDQKQKPHATQSSGAFIK